MYSCNDSNDLFHTLLTLTRPSAYYMLYRICQYTAILWVQYIDMAKYNIVTALVRVHCTRLVPTLELYQQPKKS